MSGKLPQECTISILNCQSTWISLINKIGANSFPARTFLFSPPPRPPSFPRFTRSYRPHRLRFCLVVHCPGVRLLLVHSNSVLEHVVEPLKLLQRGDDEKTEEKDLSRNERNRGVEKGSGVIFWWSWERGEQARDQGGRGVAGEAGAGGYSHTFFSDEMASVSAS
eukprot:767838-Hanusia_phi.AAC.5